MAGIATHESDTDVQIAAINFNSSGDNTVVAGVSGQKICVIKLFFTVHSATNIIIKSGTTALTGAMEFAAVGNGMAIDGDKVFMVIPNNTNFVMNNSNAVQVSGFVAYTQKNISQG